MSLDDKIEGTEVGSRELDAEIALANGWHVHADDNWIGPQGEIAVPAYTTSIDAAMTLVPEHHNWSLEFSDIVKASAWIFPPNNDGLVQFYADGVTPALALCAAALRAKAQADG